MRQRFLVCLLPSILMLGVAACGQNTGPSAPTSDNANTDPRSLALPASQDGRFSVDPPPSLRPDQAEPTGPFANIKPLELKPDGSLGALGLNLKPLLTDGVTSSEERINRLESAIIAMQADLKTLAPSMQRMALIENDMNALVAQLEALLQEEGTSPASGEETIPAPTAATESPLAAEVTSEESSMPEPLIPESEMTEVIDEQEAEPEPAPVTAQPPPPASAPQHAPAQNAAPPPPQAAPQPGASVIQGIRLGEHAEKTRVVIDISGPVTYTKDIDNMEKLLVIEMPEASLNSIDDGIFKSPLVKSWSAQPLETGKGVRIILVLSSEASVIYGHLLGPAPENPNHRLILDLKSSAVHSG